MVKESVMGYRTRETSGSSSKLDKTSVRPNRSKDLRLTFGKVSPNSIGKG